MIFFQLLRLLPTSPTSFSLLLSQLPLLSCCCRSRCFGACTDCCLVGPLCAQPPLMPLLPRLPAVSSVSWGVICINEGEGFFNSFSFSVFSVRSTVFFIFFCFQPSQHLGHLLHILPTLEARAVFYHFVPLCASWLFIFIHARLRTFLPSLT